MRLRELVVGLGQPVRPSGRRPASSAAGGSIAKRIGAGIRSLPPIVSIGLPNDVLRHDVGAAPGGEVGRLRVVGGVDGDVHRRVAHAEHDDVLADELRLVLVVVRVDLLARERVRAGERRLGQRGSQWWPLATITASYSIVSPPSADRGPRRRRRRGARRARPRSRSGSRRGSRSGRRRRRSSSAIWSWRGKSGYDSGIGKSEYSIRVARGVDVQRPVRGRDAVVVPLDPVAADAVGQLVAVERDAALVQDLGGGDAARAGADHAGAWEVWKASCADGNPGSAAALADRLLRQRCSRAGVGPPRAASARCWRRAPRNGGGRTCRRCTITWSASRQWPIVSAARARQHLHRLADAADRARHVDVEPSAAAARRRSRRRRPRARPSRRRGRPGRPAVSSVLTIAGMTTRELDAAARELAADGLGQADDRVLGRAVGGQVREAALARDRREVDHVAAAARAACAAAPPSCRRSCRAR